MTQTRWFCYDCRREWLPHAAAGAGVLPWLPEQGAPASGIVAWDPKHGCPACHSAAIAQIVYESVVPGLDVPRAYGREPLVDVDGFGVARARPPEVVPLEPLDQLPPLTPRVDPVSPPPLALASAAEDVDDRWIHLGES
jgi:hypothetical protein